MTETVTPAAAPAAPAAPAPVVAPVVATPPASLLEAGDPKVAPAEPAAPAAPAAPDPNVKWYLAEGVPGKGEPPEWLKTSKYKSADEQAKAYSELETRFGAFVGAPKDGVYTLPEVPKELGIVLDNEHPMFKGLMEWAAKSHMSQDGFNEIMLQFATYEAAQQPDVQAMKAKLGENADARLNAVLAWSKANLTPAEQKVFADSQRQHNAVEVFQAFEAIIAKTRAPAMPKPNEEVPGVSGGDTLESLAALQANAKNDKGERKYVVDPAFRHELEARRRAVTAAQAPKQ